MATITERSNSNGTKSWQVLIRIKGNPKIVQTFHSEHEADRFAKSTEHLIRSGHASLLAAPPPTGTVADVLQEGVGRIIALFLGSDQAGETHRRMSGTVLRNIGDDLKVGDIRKSWLKDFFNKMRQQHTQMKRPYSWETIVRHVGFISVAIRWRADELDIAPPPFPCARSLLPKNWKNRRTRRLAPCEEARIRGAFGRLSPARQIQAPLLLDLALETGARLQELILADWSEIDFQLAVWTIPAEHTKGSEARFVPLSIKAVETVSSLRAAALPGSSRPFHAFPNPNATSQFFRRVTKSVKVEGYRFHDLRHEAISRMVLNKRQLNTFEIMKIVGHASTEMLNRYANLRGDELVARME